MPKFSTFDLASAASRVPERQVIELTFGELLEAFLATNPNDSYSRLKKWVKTFGDRGAWGISRDELHRAAGAMIAHGYSASSVNRDLSAVGSAYKWAINVRRIAPASFHSPTRDIPRFKESMRVITMTAEEEARLRALALTFRDRRFGLLVHLLLDTGARPSEILDRTWAEFDATKGEVMLKAETTKTGRARVLHFQPSTAHLIERLQPSKARRAMLAFGGRKSGTAAVNYRKSWTTLVKMLGRPELHLYDLRHVCAARLLNGGVSVAVASQILGNSSLVLHQRYGHLESELQRQAQQRGWHAANACGFDDTVSAKEVA